MCEKGNSGYEKEKFVLLSRKKGKESELKKKEWKRRKERSIERKKMAIRLGVQMIKIEMSLGEFYVSWKRILWKSDYDEMFSFISRYLNSFIPFFQLTKHLNPWPHYKL